MEIVLGLLAVAVLATFWYFNRNKGFDANKDGKVDLGDVKPVVENTVQAVKEAADVNKDGKVDLADAKKVAETAAKKVSKPKAISKPKAPAKPKASAKPKKPKMTVVK